MIFKGFYFWGDGKTYNGTLQIGYMYVVIELPETKHLSCL